MAMTDVMHLDQSAFCAEHDAPPARSRRDAGGPGDAGGTTG